MNGKKKTGASGQGAASSGQGDPRLVLIGENGCRHDFAQLTGRPHPATTSRDFLTACGAAALATDPDLASYEIVTTPRRCRACDCTDDNCHHCIARTGGPCYWVEDDLCSACLARGYLAEIKIRRGNDNIATARIAGVTYRASCTMGDREAAARLAEKVALAIRADSATVLSFRVRSLSISRAYLKLTFAAGGEA